MIRFYDDTLDEMARFCAELTRQGIAFKGGRDGVSWWVRCTGY